MEAQAGEQGTSTTVSIMTSLEALRQGYATEFRFAFAHEACPDFLHLIDSDLRALLRASMSSKRLPVARRKKQGAQESVRKAIQCWPVMLDATCSPLTA